MEDIIVGLINGRHKTPVDRYIFDSIEDVHDFDAMHRHIMDWISKNVGIRYTNFGHGINQASDDDVSCFIGEKRLIVFVTGLTAATAELIRCCALNGVRLILMHYDKVEGDYKGQYIF